MHVPPTPGRRAAFLGAVAVILAVHAMAMAVWCGTQAPRPRGALAGRPFQVRWLAPAVPPNTVAQALARHTAPLPAGVPLPKLVHAESPPDDLSARYLPSRLLERAPLPRSAPDATLLDGIRSSGLPIRLRLFIDDRGTVAKVDLLHALQGDEEAAGRLERMFLATRFLPGRFRGRDVRSFLDIEVNLSDLV